MLVYVGTYSNRGSKGIYVFRLDPASGALTALGTFAGELKNPSFLTVHPSGRYLYAIGESGIGGGDPGGPVAAFTLDPATGMGTPLNHQSSRGGGPCFISLDKNAKNALVANYGGGSIAVLPIGPDGGLQPATAFVQHRGGSGVNPHRQEGPHAHSIRVDPGNRYAIAADLGLDALLVYRFDAARGTLAPNDPPKAATAPGAGPRHFVFHPAAPFVYAINELNSTVAAYQYDGRHGTLREVQTLSTLPEGVTGTNYPAEIAITPSGRFLYGSNRGHDSIAAFSVDPSSGRLQPIGDYPTRGKNPRNFGIDPTGTLLIAANQDTDNLVVFHLDPQTGRLLPAGRVAEVPSPVCIRFVP